MSPRDPVHGANITPTLRPRSRINQTARKDARAFGCRGRDRRLSRHTYGRPAGTTKTRSPRRNTKKICSVGETKKNVFFVFFVDLRAFVVAFETGDPSR